MSTNENGGLDEGTDKSGRKIKKCSVRFGGDTEVMQDFHQDENQARKIIVRIGDTMEELLEKARKIGPGRSRRNCRNPLFSYEPAG